MQPKRPNPVVLVCVSEGFSKWGVRVKLRVFDMRRMHFFLNFFLIKNLNNS